MPKYFRTVITYEVLTEGEPWKGTLEDLAYDTTEGHASGMFLSTEVEEVSEGRMAGLLVSQGSDPEFLIFEEDEE